MENTAKSGIIGSMEKLPNPEEERLLGKARQLFAEAEEFATDPDRDMHDPRPLATTFGRNMAVERLATLLDTLNLAKGMGFRNEELTELWQKAEKLLLQLHSLKK